MGVTRICELLRLVEPTNENNGLDASEQRIRGPVMAKPWTVWKSGLALWSGGKVRVDRTQSRSRHNTRANTRGLGLAAGSCSISRSHLPTRKVDNG